MPRSKVENVPTIHKDINLAMYNATTIITTCAILKIYIVIMVLMGNEYCSPECFH